MDAAAPRESLFRLMPIAPAGPARPAAERFIAEAFRDKHGARVQEFLPELVGLHSKNGVLRAVAGFRPAATGPLFLEQYLARPVETELSRQLGFAVARDTVVEVGNLAGSSCRSARHLVSQLPRLLRGRGYTWVVFTATSIVRDVIVSVGANLLELAPAEAGRLAAGAAAWGRYYDGDPRVMAGYLPTALELSSRRWPGRRRRD